MPNGTEGVARFFAGLGAGPALRQRAAAQGRLDAMREALTDAQIRNTGADAGLKETKLDALDPATLAQSFAGMGLDDGQSQGAAGLVRAGNNADQVGGLMKALQVIASQRAARDAAVRGDKNAANANLFGATDKPVDLSRVVDGVSFDPTATPDQNVFDPTAVGQSMIRQHDASAASSAASAAATRAKLPAELRKLEAEAGKAGGKPANVSLPPMDKLRNTIGAQAGTDLNGRPVYDVSPEALGRFLVFQNNHAATDPRFNDGDYALQQFALAHAAPDTVTVPPGTLPTGEVESPAEDAREPGEESPAKAAPAGGPVMPKNKAEFDALPSGTLFINPADGRVMRKK